MADTSRRGFLKSASIGAAAMGMLSFLPTIAKADDPTCAPQTATAPVLSTAPAVGMPAAGVPITVFINNPASGQGVIFVGEQMFDFKNPELIKALTAAIA